MDNPDIAPSLHALAERLSAIAGLLKTVADLGVDLDVDSKLRLCCDLPIGLDRTLEMRLNVRGGPRPCADLKEDAASPSSPDPECSSGATDVEESEAEEPAPTLPVPGRKVASGPWGKAELAELERLLDAGLSAGEIAQRLGRSPQGVGSQIGRLRRRLLQQAPRDAGWTAAEDLELVEWLSRGSGLHAIPAGSPLARWSHDELKARWQHLMPRPSMEAQQRLMARLRKEVREA